MTTDQIILFAIFAAVFTLLIWGRWRYDIVAFGALMTGVLAGVVPAGEAFAGFGHPATLVVALVLVVSAGLVRSGAVFMITRTLVDSARPLGRHIMVMGGVGAVLSGFMNNVAALALLMPVDVQTAKKAGRNVGLSLMPLSFATILGGMATMIGTPPNIIVATIREDRLGEPFRMFDYAPVGVIAALAGLAFVSLIGWRLIPRTGGKSAGETLMEEKRYVSELIVPEDADIIGKRLHELEDEAESAGIAILGLARGGRRMFGAARYTALEAGDAIVMEAAPGPLDEFRSALSLAWADEEGERRLEEADENAVFFEVVVPEGARIAGRTAQSIGLTWRRDAVLMGVSREGRRIDGQIRSTEIYPGDIRRSPRQGAQKR